MTSCDSLKEYFTFETIPETPIQQERETSIISDGIVPVLLCSKADISDQAKAGMTDISIEAELNDVITADRNGNIVIKLDLLDKYEIANIRVSYSVNSTSADNATALLYLSDDGTTYLSVTHDIQKDEASDNTKAIEYILHADGPSNCTARYIWLQFKNGMKITCHQIAVSAYSDDEHPKTITFEDN